MLQHRPGQVRLWPLASQLRGPDALERMGYGRWPTLKQDYPVGAVIEAVVTNVFVANQEYCVRFGVTPKDDVATLIWDSHPPQVGDRGNYLVVGHLDTTCRLILQPVSLI